MSEVSKKNFSSGICSIFMIAVCFLLSTLCLVSAQAITHAADNKVIVVGGNRDYPPYEFLDEDGNPTGYNVELTKAIANTMGMNVSFRLGAWVDVRKALDSGSVDVMQGMSYSDGRAAVVDFSIPHTVVNHSVFARKGSSLVLALDDLEGKEVAFHNRGFIHDFIVEKGLNVKWVLTDTQADALRLIASGKHDYAVVASLPAAYLINKYQLINLVPAARSIAAVKYCYAVRKGNTELLAKFNEGLAILKQTGQYQAIYDKWLGILEPTGVPWGKIVRYGSLVTTLFVLALAGSLLWSRTLRKQVALRTAALEQEVIERQRAVEELRLRHQQLVQADKMASLGILVSGVAHEINNPNGLILINTPLIMDYLKDTDPIVESHYLKHGDFMVAGIAYSRLKMKLAAKLLEIQDSAKKIKRIVDDLKDFARRDESELSSLVDINAIAQTAVRLAENTIRKSTDYFHPSYEPDLPKIRGNAQRIEQVVVNLILNACQALEDSSKAIFLSTSYNRKSGEVILKIRDEGIGIAAEHIQHLLDPFFTTKREMGGTGLGLYVSAKIVKEHRGSMDFSSIPREGTTVIIRLTAVIEEISS
jgi:polar amino acid transport system substrate-binding protein